VLIEVGFNFLPDNGYVRVVTGLAEVPRDLTRSRRIEQRKARLPKRGWGYLDVVDAQNTTAYSQNTVAVTLNTVADTPNAAAGTLNTVAGTLNTVAGTLNTVAGTPNTVAGTPNTVAGTANTVAGTPNTVAGTPKARALRGVKEHRNLSGLT
jgi:hypothetical protein